MGSLSIGSAPFERLALTHEGMADAVGLAAELDEPPVVDDAADCGGILAFILNEAAVVHRFEPMAGAIRRVTYAVSAAALGQVLGLVAHDEHKRL